MKTIFQFGLGMLIVVSLVLAGLMAGWVVWGERLWAPGMPALVTERAGASTEGCWDGRGRMGRGGVSAENCAAWTEEGSSEQGSTGDASLTIREAEKAVERYLALQGQAHLEVAEVMEFERNFYAIVREPDSGIGAMELLVDKVRGTVGPEMGPNMMWNTRYGVHRRGRMMGRGGGPNAIRPEEAVTLAQRWLAVNRPGVAADEHADSFYGYYTIHTLKDGEIEGMLSVHGTTGRVWYHAWHGSFIQVIAKDEAH